MEARARVKHIRIAPRKLRPLLTLIRKKYLSDAMDMLAAMRHKKTARYTLLLLKSVAANAKVKKMDEAHLFISDIRADGGPTMKRFMARSMGRANRILKRTSHISVVVTEKVTKRTTAASEQTAKAKKEAPKKAAGRAAKK